MPHDQQLIQSIHASYEAALHITPKTTQIHSLVLCQVPDEDTLLKENTRLNDVGISTVLFQEPDMNDAYTSLATEPLNGDRRKRMSRYKLWRSNI